MGFFDWLPAPDGAYYEDYNNPYKVDNSAEAVERRLAFLRLTPAWDEKSKAQGLWIKPAEMSRLPREITYELKQESYFVIVEPYNPAFCEYTDEEKWETITNYIYSNDSLTSRISQVVPYNEFTPADRMDVARYGDGVIVPLSSIPKEEVDFTVPDEICDVLALTPRGKVDTFSTQLREYFRQDSWRNPSTDMKYATRISDDPVSPVYRMGIALHLDIRINGIEADKCNLTITEQYEIEEAIRRNLKEYRFESDGKERPEALREMASGTYLWDSFENGFGMRDSINNLTWYGSRNDALNAIERIRDERKAQENSGRGR